MSFKAKTIKDNFLTKELQCALCNEYKDEVVINTESNTGLCNPCYSKNRTDLVSEEVLQEGGEKEMPRKTNKDLRTDKQVRKAKSIKSAKGVKTNGSKTKRETSKNPK